MTTITPQSIADLGRYLDRYTEISEGDARALLRAASSGQPIRLPDATDFSGEVLRGQLAAIFRSIPAIAGDTAPVLAVNPAAVPEPPASEALAPPAPMSFESRQVAFRAIAGPRLEAMADALAATTVSLDEGTRAIQTARANLPSEKPRTPSIAERAKGLEEFGSSYEPPATPKSKAADGWKKAMAAAQTGGVA